MTEKTNNDVLYKECHRKYKYDNGVLYLKVFSHRKPIGSKIGHLNEKGYLVTSLFGKLVGVHRIVFLMHHGYLPNEIDHIDGNRSNNLIENLREALFCQNQYNSRIRKDNASGYKGVGWYKPKQMWRARCNANKKSFHLGYFKNIEDAINVVKKFREIHHGEFAHH